MRAHDRKSSRLGPELERWGCGETLRLFTEARGASTRLLVPLLTLRAVEEANVEAAELSPSHAYSGAVLLRCYLWGRLTEWGTGVPLAQVEILQHKALLRNSGQLS
jgi:hypothetical protein